MPRRLAATGHVYYSLSSSRRSSRESYSPAVFTVLRKRLLLLVTLCCCVRNLPCAPAPCQVVCKKLPWFTLGNDLISKSWCVGLVPGSAAMYV